jgi:glycosyltransferase involved in cell wall biosynthesis
VKQVLPKVIQKRRQTRLMVVGAQATQAFIDSVTAPGVEFVGTVDDIREPLSRYSVFLAPILAGSGVRVKLLEAFAAGIPVVSTRIGAEGLTETAADIVALADDADEFAEQVLRLLEDPVAAQALAKAARLEVKGCWDSGSATRDLHQHYTEIVHAKRTAAADGSQP